MPFTLDQLNFLDVHLPAAIPPEFIENKRRAEEFKTRREKVAAEADGKPADWWLKAKFDEALKRADDSAGQKQFAPALTLLDEAGQLLKQPETSPEVLAALQELEKRQTALVAEITAANAFESPIGGELKSGLEAVTQARGERNADVAGKRLAELEQMVKTLAQMKGAAKDAAKEAQDREQAKIKARVDELKSQIEAGLAEIKTVVESIQEPSVRQASAGGFEKLNASLASALKLEQPGDQESALTALSKEVAPLKSVADKAALESAALLAARARVATLKLQAEKELADVDAVVKAISEPSLQEPEAKKLEALQQRLITISGLTDPAAQEQGFSALIEDIAKLKESAEAAKVKADELTAARLRVDALKKQIEAGLAEIKQVVGSIEEAALRQPAADGLEKLNASVVAALKLNQLGEQEAALTAASREIAPLKSVADQAALDSAALIVARARVAALKLQAEKELAEADVAVKAISEPSLQEPEAKKLEALQLRQATTSGLTDPAAQEQGFSALIADIPKLKQSAEEARVKAAAQGEYNAAYAAEIKLAHETAAATLKNADEPMKKRFKAELDGFEPKATAHDNAVQTKDWATAKGALADLKSTADTLNAAAAKYALDVQAYQTAYSKIKAAVDQSKSVAAWSGCASDLATEIADYKKQEKVVEDAVGAGEWKTAADGCPALDIAAKALNKVYEAWNEYDDEYAKVKVAVDRAKTLADWNGADLATEIAEYAKQRKMVEDAVASRRWENAADGCPALGIAATTLNTVYAAWEAHYHAYAAISAVHVDAWNLANKPPGAPEAAKTTFNEKNGKYYAAKNARKWGEAKAAIPPLKLACDAVLAIKGNSAAAHFYTEFDRIKTDVENAGKCTGSKGLASLVRAFNAKNKAVTDQIDKKNWAKAEAGITALGLAAAALTAAHAKAKVDKSAFEAEWKKIGEGDLAAARELAAAPPDNLKADAAKFLKAYQAANDDRTSENWGPGTPKATALKTAVEELLDARKSFNTGVTPTDSEKLEKRLKALEPKTKTASATGVPKFINALQKDVNKGVADVTDLLSTKDYATAEVRLKKLEIDTGWMVTGKAGYKQVLDSIAGVEAKEDAAARKRSIKAPKVAQLRDKGLAAAKASVLAAADAGLIAEANRRIAVWKTQADEWKGSATRASEVHSALTASPLDKGVLKTKTAALLKRPGGAKVFDDIVAALGDKPPKDLMKILFKARFDVDLELTKGGTDHVTAKGSKSVKKIYDLMALAPDTHTTNSKSLKKITRDTTKQESGWYMGGAHKKIFLNCGRADGNQENKMGDPFHLPDIEPECEPADTPPTTFFNWTTEHEIGHAVDDLGPYMGSRFQGDEYGGWQPTSANDAATAAMDRFICSGQKFPLDAIEDLLTASPKQPYDTPPPLPTGADQQAWEARWREVVDWCYDGRAANDPWDNGSRAKSRAINGRVYHEAYDDGQWVSYSIGARTEGITGYQFRAPGEWFSELYAAYRTGRLKPAHPAVKWLETL